MTSFICSRPIRSQHYHPYGPTLLLLYVKCHTFELLGHFQREENGSKHRIFQKITTILFNTHLWIFSYLLLLINSDVTESEVVSIPYIYARGLFRNDFVKPSDIFVLLALLLLLRFQDGKFRSSLAF